MTDDLERRIIETERTLATLREQARAELLLAIARASCGLSFSSRGLWDRRRLDPDLRRALRTAGIRDTRCLGAFLNYQRQTVGTAVHIEATGRDNLGTVWVARVRL